MLSISSHLAGSTVTATDGAIGHVKSLFFDDQSWAIRYLVVDTGPWMVGREVLISPYAVQLPLSGGKNVAVALTRVKVEDSPDVDTHQPVSRQHERAYADYYDYPEYWGGGGIWGMGAYPLLPSAQPVADDVTVAKARRHEEFQLADVHLRSTAKVAGYNIEATDGSIGHVQDFVFEQATWVIRYLVIDTRNWWPGGRKVLIPTHWIAGIDWSSNSVSVGLTREQVRHSPAYEEMQPIERDYEKQLHDAYQRAAYWD